MMGHWCITRASLVKFGMGCFCNLLFLRNILGELLRLRESIDGLLVIKNIS
jgi:hypothetical protein